MDPTARTPNIINAKIRTRADIFTSLLFLYFDKVSVFTVHIYACGSCVRKKGKEMGDISTGSRVRSPRLSIYFRTIVLYFGVYVS